MDYDADLFRKEMERDEGVRALAYDDKTGETAAPGHVVQGWISVGIGRNLVGKGLTPDEISYLFEGDRGECESDLDTHVSWWRGMSDARQRGLLNLCFNLGWGNGSRGLSSFKSLLASLQAGDYAGAAADLMRTALASEEPARAQRIADLFTTG